MKACCRVANGVVTKAETYMVASLAALDQLVYGTEPRDSIPMALATTACL